jgi:adenylate kinase
MDLVLFGMQGSGKGTQASVLTERCDFEVFEAGAALRKLAAQDSELGMKVKSIIESGALVPTEVVMEIIEDFIHHLPKGKAVLFDGIPRSEDQMELFNALMEKEGRGFKGLVIELTEEEALKRLTTRRICGSCKKSYPAFYKGEACENCGGDLITRRDDTPDAIRVRLDTFLGKTVPVIESYKADAKMLSVNGEQDIQNVTTDILEVLKSDFPSCQ